MNNRVTNRHHMTAPLIPQHDDTDDQTTAHKSDYDRFWELLYDSDCCDNPILQTLCQIGLDHITAAKHQRQTCDLLLVQHMTLETTPPPQKKARVEQMIKLAKTMAQTNFSISDIKRFYDILAPRQDTTDTSRRYRRRKRPTPPPARHRHEDQQQQEQQAEESHGGEN